MASYVLYLYFYIYVYIYISLKSTFYSLNIFVKQVESYFLKTFKFSAFLHQVQFLKNGKDDLKKGKDDLKNGRHDLKTGKDDFKNGKDNFKKSIYLDVD